MSNQVNNSHAKKNGAKVKGYIKNNATGSVQSFMYNPTEFQYSRSVEYGDISAPGRPYPGTQYVKGDARSFSVTLFVYDNPSSGEIEKRINFLGRFLTPETPTSGYVKPPDMTFCLGSFVRKCVMESLDINIQMWDAKMKPTQAEFTLQLRQV